MTLWVGPASRTVPVNGAFTVQIVAELGAAMNPFGLAGYEFHLVYDPKSLEVVGVEDAGQLSGPNGRIVRTLGPNIDNTIGRMTFGAFSFRETDPQIAGPTGAVVLANVTLRARQVGVTTISLGNALVIDTQANPWPDPGAGRQVITQPGTVSIETYTPSPTAKSPATDTPSPVAPTVAVATSAPPASPTSPPRQPTMTPTFTLTPITTSTATPTFTLAPVATSTAMPTFTLTPVTTDTQHSK